MSTLNELKEINLEIITPLQAAIVYLSDKHEDDAALAALELTRMQNDINTTLSANQYCQNTINDMNLIIKQFHNLLNVHTTTQALSKIAVLMREETLSENLLSKALGYLNTCSESDSLDLFNEIAEAFGENSK